MCVCKHPIIDPSRPPLRTSRAALFCQKRLDFDVRDGRSTNVAENARRRKTYTHYPRVGGISRTSLSVVIIITTTTRRGRVVGYDAAVRVSFDFDARAPLRRFVSYCAAARSRCYDGYTRIQGVSGGWFRFEHLKTASRVFHSILSGNTRGGGRGGRRSGRRVVSMKRAKNYSPPVRYGRSVELREISSNFEPKNPCHCSPVPSAYKTFSLMPHYV